MTNPLHTLKPQNEATLALEGHNTTVESLKYSLDHLLDMANYGSHFANAFADFEENLDFEAFNRKYNTQIDDTLVAFGLYLLVRDSDPSDYLDGDNVSDAVVSKSMSAASHIGGSFKARELLHRLLRYGMTDAFAQELNETLANFQFFARLTFSKARERFVWSHTMAWPENHSYSDNVVWDFCQCFEHGLLDSLKRCALQECNKFHVRKGKWCKDSCGSRFRVREKRKRDKGKARLYERKDKVPETSSLVDKINEIFEAGDITSPNMKKTAKKKSTKKRRAKK